LRAYAAPNQRDPGVAKPTAGDMMPAIDDPFDRRGVITGVAELTISRAIDPHLA